MNFIHVESIFPSLDESLTLTSSGSRSLKTVSFSPFRLDGFKAYQETVYLPYLTNYF